MDDWDYTASGDRCLWCKGTDYEPFDSDDADQTLCRGHVAEYEGLSLDGLDRADSELWKDECRWKSCGRMNSSEPNS